MGEREPNQGVGASNNLLALGMTFAAGVVFFALGGLALDRWLGLTPVFTIVGTLGGATLSFLNVYWKLSAETEARKHAQHRRGS